MRILTYRNYINTTEAYYGNRGATNCRIININSQSVFWIKCFGNELYTYFESYYIALMSRSGVNTCT